MYQHGVSIPAAVASDAVAWPSCGVPAVCCGNPCNINETNGDSAPGHDGVGIGA